jgi:16S rRNA (cytidine1402-2'-O)-methyltransferase
VENSIEKSVLYIVATPIGNLKDVTYRAVEVLSQVDRIAAEDTRHSARLLKQYQIPTPCSALHEHNERQVAHSIIEKIRQGETWALISDAGTPVVSDPGYFLIKEAISQGVKVVPVPGPNAAIAALSASGMPSDRFVFEGFLPAKSAARQKHLHALAAESRTMLFYESPHRILDSLQDMQSVFGDERQMVFARELTKTYETIRQGTIAQILQWIANDTQQLKGEMVLIVAGAEKVSAGALGQAEEVLSVLLTELSVKQAAHLASLITGMKKNELYQRALAMKSAER